MATRMNIERTGPGTRKINITTTTPLPNGKVLMETRTVDAHRVRAEGGWILTETSHAFDATDSFDPAYAADDLLMIGYTPNDDLENKALACAMAIIPDSTTIL